LKLGKKDVGLGIGTSTKDGKTVITSVLRNGPAWKYGLNVNDELEAIDGYKIASDLNQFLSAKQAGDTLKIMVNRDGFLREISLILEPYSSSSFRLEALPNPTDEQMAVMRKWLGN
jgi:predicted metalloprotease with PDZ domain